MHKWEHVDILRLLPIAVFIMYVIFLLADKEVKSFIPLYIAVPMLLLYFTLTPVTLITALIRVLATFTWLFGLAMSLIGVAFGINLYPDIMQFKVYGYFLIGLALLLISFKLPAWSLNDT